MADVVQYPNICDEWKMYAGRMTERGRMHIANCPRTVRAYGDDPIPVTVTEDPEGTHWGWIDADRTERGPVMIQPHRVLFDVQFAYGPDVEEELGKGRIVRLRVEDD